MNDQSAVVPFPTLESALKAIERFAKVNNVAPADVVAIFTAGRLAADALAPQLVSRDAEPIVVVSGPAPIPSPPDSGARKAG